MKVFFELGNSQIKSAILVHGCYEYLGSIPNQSVLDETLLHEFQLDTLDVEGVYLSSVASAQMNSLFIQHLQNIFGCYPTLLTTQHLTAGIECGYRDFEQLGVDRWMAVIGGAAHNAKPVLIVDAGTALTVDAVVDKKHLGGFIVPGLGLMRQTLLDQTARLKQASQQTDAAEAPKEGLLAQDTQHGVMGGTLYMASAYINQLVCDLEQETGRQFDCLGTGGDFLQLAPMLDKPFTYVEDLTLLGMVEVIALGSDWQIKK